MAPTTKAEKKAVGDAAAWMFNVITSVGIIIVNKLSWQHMAIVSVGILSFIAM